jgi:hypothetical protein
VSGSFNLYQLGQPVVGGCGPIFSLVVRSFLSPRYQSPGLPPPSNASSFCSAATSWSSLTVLASAYLAKQVRCGPVASRRDPFLWNLTRVLEGADAIAGAGADAYLVKEESKMTRPAPPLLLLPLLCRCCRPTPTTTKKKQTL